MSTSSCLFPWTLKRLHLSLYVLNPWRSARLEDLSIDTFCLWQASLLTSLSPAAVMREQPHTVLLHWQLCSSNGEQPHTVNRQLWLCYNKHWLIQGSEELIKRYSVRQVDLPWVPTLVDGTLCKRNWGWPFSGQGGGGGNWLVMSVRVSFWEYQHICYFCCCLFVYLCC